MISVQEARRLILEHAVPLPAERTALLEALGRTIASPVTAPFALPPFANAAMDGYAVRRSDCLEARADAPVWLPVAFEVAAGQAGSPALEPGQAARIMTGAELPEGAEAVIPHEEAREQGGQVAVTSPPELGRHIRSAGEEVRAGARIFEAGMILTPARLALLASLGRSHVTVHAPARVAILTTGDELVDPGEPLKPGQIYNANAFAMTAMVAEAGAVPIRMAVARDDRAQTVKALQKALRFDAVITTGGVSKGAYDFVGEAIDQLGSVLFREVAQQPGKPFTFGTALGKPIFGLPGNPAAAMTAFEYFVRPALRKMMGHRSQDRPRVIAVMIDAFEKKPGKQAFVRAHVDQTADGYEARLAGGHGAGQLHSMASANGLVIVPAASGGFEPGAELETILLTPAELCGMACLPLGGDQTVSRLATMI